jgi:hypothetical protein
MLNRTLFIGRAILAATILLLLGACVMGTPILSPMDISLLGAGSAEPLKWPFENTPQTLELECGAERIVINVSPAKARVTLSDSTGELERDFFASPKLRYFRMIRVTQDEHELIVTEGDVDEFKTDWLVLPLDGSAELEYEDISYSCRVEGQ